MRRSGEGKDGWSVWITGLPGSDKSLVSEALMKLLAEKGIRAQLLSSDALRKVLTRAREKGQDTFCSEEDLFKSSASSVLNGARHWATL